MLLHGGGFDHAELTWRLAIPELAQNRRIIAPDMPGYGESDSFGRAHDLDDLTAWLIAFLDATGIVQADIAGVSMGGGIALNAGLMAPTRVRRLIPVGAYGLMPRAPFHPLAWALARSPAAGLVYRAAAASETLTRIGLGAAYADPSRVDPETVALVRDVARDQADRRSFDAFLARELTVKGLQSDLSPRLHKIPHRTLLIQGTKDRLVPVRHARNAVRKLPNAELYLMETGHWPMRERPKEFTTRLKAFLDAD
ncbi:alpha/beta fold hydrolase [Aestuariibius sp. 2305UL40-4]|uniref:alpha/beta fold hydrolase n=1 Tax=Aestuariibius violaceus TaxID=3234132 RepID=UPI00346BAFC1